MSQSYTLVMELPMNVATTPIADKMLVLCKKHNVIAPALSSVQSSNVNYLWNFEKATKLTLTLVIFVCSCQYCLNHIQRSQLSTITVYYIAKIKKNKIYQRNIALWKVFLIQ